MCSPLTQPLTVKRIYLFVNSNISTRVKCRCHVLFQRSQHREQSQRRAKTLKKWNVANYTHCQTYALPFPAMLSLLVYLFSPLDSVYCTSSFWNWIFNICQFFIKLCTHPRGLTSYSNISWGRWKCLTTFPVPWNKTEWASEQGF